MIDQLEAVELGGVPGSEQPCRQVPQSYERCGRRDLPRIGYRRSPVRAWLVSLRTVPFVCQRGGVDPLGGIECT
jgi:hypothetical protein